MTTAKAWDRTRPFTRINSPSFVADPALELRSTAEGGRRATGQGFTRGAHSTRFGPTLEDGPIDALADDLMRAIPNWVSVEARDRLEEIEGQLDRSFQTWTDFPPTQWHSWYDWNYHLEPATGYRYLRGLGNEPHGPSATPAGQRRVSLGETMECEWDTGAFGPRPGIMFGGAVPWPMTGSRVWLAGRWIYDCGHSSNDEVPEGPTQGLMRTELHPCKAMAFAWWEAEKFPEHGDLFVPAIKFLFFTSKFGGYHEFADVHGGDAEGKDFEFIVDLPKPEGLGGEQSHAIGHTPGFALNTISLRRPTLLKKFDHAPFARARGPVDGRLLPVIEELPPPEGASLPEQVKLTVPVTRLPPNTAAYGVIVSLGWLDVDGSQARRVKRCRVSFENLRRGQTRKPQIPTSVAILAPWNLEGLQEEWLLKAAVNHRWFQWFFEGSSRGENHSLGNTRAEFFLDRDDPILFSSHGAELDGTHEAVGRDTLRLNGRVARWRPHLDSWNPAMPSRHFHDRADYVQARRVVEELTSMLNIGASDQNEPIGLIDPGKGPPSDRPLNPFPIATPDRIERTVELMAFPASEVGTSAELVEATSGQFDYLLRMRIEVEPQRVPGGS